MTFSQESQVLNVDEQGRLVDYNSVLKSKNYEAISAFDTISYDPILIAAVYVRNKKLGLVQINGHELTDALYSNFHNIEQGSNSVKFNQGYLGVTKGNKYGVIDLTGKEVVPLNYDRFKILKKRERQPYDSTHLYIFEGQIGYKRYIFNEKHEILEKNEETAVTLSFAPYSDYTTESKKNRFGYIYEHTYQNNFSIVKKFKSPSGYGVYNSETDNLVVPQTYSLLKFGHENQFLSKHAGKWGIIDINGNILVDHRYDYIETYGAGYSVEQNEKMAYFSEDFTIKTDFIYDGEMLRRRSGFGYLTFLKNGKLGLLNSLGEEATDFIYDDIDLELIETSHNTLKVLFVPSLHGKKGLLDEEGSKLLDFKYDNIEIIQSSKENKHLFSVIFEKDKRFGFYDKHFNLILNDFSKIYFNYHSENSLLASKLETFQSQWYSLDLGTNDIDTLPEDFFIKGNNGGYYTFESGLVSHYHTMIDGQYGINKLNGDPIITPLLDLGKNTEVYNRSQSVYPGLILVAFIKKNEDRFQPDYIHEYYLDYNYSYSKLD